MSEKEIPFSKFEQLERSLGTIDKDFEPVSYEEAMDRKWKCIVCHEIKEITDPENWRPTQFEVWHGPICKQCWLILTS